MQFYFRYLENFRFPEIKSCLPTEELRGIIVQSIQILPVVVLVLVLVVVVVDVVGLLLY